MAIEIVHNYNVLILVQYEQYDTIFVYYTLHVVNLIHILVLSNVPLLPNVNLLMYVKTIVYQTINPLFYRHLVLKMTRGANVSWIYVCKTLNNIIEQEDSLMSKMNIAYHVCF